MKGIFTKVFFFEENIDNQDQLLQNTDSFKFFVFKAKML